MSALAKRKRIDSEPIEEDCGLVLQTVNGLKVTCPAKFPSTQKLVEHVRKDHQLSELTAEWLQFQGIERCPHSPCTAIAARGQLNKHKCHYKAPNDKARDILTTSLFRSRSSTSSTSPHMSAPRTVDLAKNWFVTNFPQYTGNPFTLSAAVAAASAQQDSSSPVEEQLPLSPPKKRPCLSSLSSPVQDKGLGLGGESQQINTAPPQMAGGYSTGTLPTSAFVQGRSPAGSPSPSSSTTATAATEVSSSSSSSSPCASPPPSPLLSPPASPSVFLPAQNSAFALLSTKASSTLLPRPPATSAASTRQEQKSDASNTGGLGGGTLSINAPPEMGCALAPSTVPRPHVVQVPQANEPTPGAATNSTYALSASAPAFFPATPAAAPLVASTQATTTATTAPASHDRHNERSGGGTENTLTPPQMGSGIEQNISPSRVVAQDQDSKSPLLDPFSSSSAAAALFQPFSLDSQRSVSSSSSSSSSPPFPAPAPKADTEWRKMLEVATKSLPGESDSAHALRQQRLAAVHPFLRVKVSTWTVVPQEARAPLIQALLPLAANINMTQDSPGLSDQACSQFLMALVVLLRKRRGGKRGEKQLKKLLEKVNEGRASVRELIQQAQPRNSMEPAATASSSSPAATLDVEAPPTTGASLSAVSPLSPAPPSVPLPAAPALAPRASTRPSRTPFTDEEENDRKTKRVVSRAVALVNRGHVGQAYKSLTQRAPLNAFDANVRQKLHDIHAPMSAPAPLSVSAPLPPVVVDSSTVLAALRKAANGAAAGPTTLDCDILLLLCEQKEIMEALTVMVGKMLNNDVGPITKSLVLPRRLIPTGKKDDGVRPISIGESVTKVASIVSLFMLTPDDKRDILGPCQYAYNRPGAAESAVHAVRAALAASDSSILISADIEQAYPNSDRAAVLRELLADPRTATQAPLFLFKYSEPTPLLLFKGDILVDVVFQHNGITQGDPTGTWDFCTFVAPIVTAVQSRHPGAKLIMDADDINIVGPPAAAFALFTDLSSCLQKKGLFLKLPKCFALWPRVSAPPAAVTSSAAALALPLKLKSAKVLGAIIGEDDEAHKQFLSDSAADTLRTLDVLHHSSFPAQHAAILLRACVLPSFNYSLRTAFPSTSLQVAKQIDTRVLSFVSSKFLLPVSLPDAALTQIQLPIRSSGLGFCSLAETADAAFVSSFLLFAHHNKTPLVIPPAERLATELQGALDRLFQHDTTGGISKHLPRQASTLFSSAASFHPKKLQSSLSNVRHTASISRLLQQAPSPHQQARLVSLSTPYTGLWLTVLPTDIRFSLSTLDYCLAVRIRLGLPISDSLVPGLRCVCGTQMQLDDHWLCCKLLTKTAINARHECIKRIVRSFAVGAGCHQEDEPHVSATDSRRGDVLITVAPKPIAVDVSVAHPAAATFESAACKQQYKTAIDRENEKLKEYGDLKEYDWRPFVCESFGAIGPTADSLMKMLAQRAVSFFSKFSPGLSPNAVNDKILRDWRSALSFAIQHGNTNIVKEGARKCKHRIVLRSEPFAYSDGTPFYQPSVFKSAILPTALMR